MYWFALALWLGMLLFCIVYEWRMALRNKQDHVTACKNRLHQTKVKLEVFDVAKQEAYQQAFKDALRDERKQ